MTCKEADLIAQMLDGVEHPSVPGATYDLKTGKRVEENSLAECDRKLASADYKAGWYECAKPRPSLPRRDAVEVGTAEAQVRSPQFPDPTTEWWLRAIAKGLNEKTKAQMQSGVQCPPLVLVVCTQSPIDGTPWPRESCVVPVLCGGQVTRATREAMIDDARAIAIAGRAVAAITCVVAWSVTMPRGEYTPDMPRPMDHPSRREALVTLLEWRGGDPVAIVSMVTRDQGFVDFDEVTAPTEYMDPESQFDSILVRDLDAIPALMHGVAREVCRGILIDRSRFVDATADNRGGEVPRG